MAVTTFLIEWDWDNLASLVIAERALREKSAGLRKIMLELAAEQEERRRLA